jgi:hypothetical protein
MSDKRIDTARRHALKGIAATPPALAALHAQPAAAADFMTMGRTMTTISRMTGHGRHAAGPHDSPINHPSDRWIPPKPVRAVHHQPITA